MTSDESAAFDVGSTAEMAAMMGFEIPPPHTSLRLVPTTEQTVRVELTMQPDLGIDLVPDSLASLLSASAAASSASVAPGSEEDYSVEMFTANGQGDAAELAKLLATCLSEATTETLAAVDSEPSRSGPHLALGQGQDGDGPLDLEEVDKSEVPADLTSLLGTLRDQLRSTDYLESHPPDPSILSAEPADDWEEEADAIDAAHVAGVSPELAGLLGTLHNQLRAGGLASELDKPAIDYSNKVVYDIGFLKQFAHHNSELPEGLKRWEADPTPETEKPKRERKPSSTDVRGSPNAMQVVAPKVPSVPADGPAVAPKLPPAKAPSAAPPRAKASSAESSCQNWRQASAATWAKVVSPPLPPAAAPVAVPAAALLSSPAPVATQAAASLPHFTVPGSSAAASVHATRASNSAPLGLLAPLRTLPPAPVPAVVPVGAVPSNPTRPSSHAPVTAHYSPAPALPVPTPLAAAPLHPVQQPPVSHSPSAASQHLMSLLGVMGSAPPAATPPLQTSVPAPSRMDVPSTSRQAALGGQPRAPLSAHSPVQPHPPPPRPVSSLGTPSAASQHLQALLGVGGVNQTPAPPVNMPPPPGQLLQPQPAQRLQSQQPYKQPPPPQLQPPPQQLQQSLSQSTQHLQALLGITPQHPAQHNVPAQRQFVPSPPQPQPQPQFQCTSPSTQHLQALLGISGQRLAEQYASQPSPPPRQLQPFFPEQPPHPPRGPNASHSAGSTPATQHLQALLGISTFVGGGATPQSLAQSDPWAQQPKSRGGFWDP
uniref:Uncharacterized protein n=1 Tax=Haptolina ericina TaxID=156174 RepID=A0A7S3AXE3_9EUKA